MLFILFGVVFLLVLCVSASWYAAGNFLHPRTRVEEYDIRDFVLPVEEVSFASMDGVPLSGWFVRGTRPETIIFVHGYSRRRDELLPHAQALFEAGYNVCIFDCRSRGKSSGESVTFGYKEHLDVLGAVAYLKTRSDVDARHIGGVGVSLGAVALIRAAAETSDIRAVVAEAPFNDLRETMRKNSVKYVPFLPSFLVSLLYPIFFLFFLIIKIRIGAGVFKSVNILNAVSRISPRALFLIYDENDDMVRLNWRIPLWRAAKDPKHIWIVPGGEHARAFQAHPREYSKRVTDFFARYFLN